MSFNKTLFVFVFLFTLPAVGGVFHVVLERFAIYIIGLRRVINVFGMLEN